MATTARKINKRKIVIIQAYSIIAMFICLGAIVGFVIGKFILPSKAETITITETLNTPSYESSNLPKVEDITYFDVPISHSLQRYIFEACADNKVPVTLVMAMIDCGSQFNPEIVSKSEDYGLMQINNINHNQLAEKYRCADMLNPYQNIFCGIKIIKNYLDEYENDYTKALMAYNMSDYGAKKAWSNGVNSTNYTVKVLGLWEYYEKELQNTTKSKKERGDIK